MGRTICVTAHFFGHPLYEQTKIHAYIRPSPALCLPSANEHSHWPKQHWLPHPSPRDKWTDLTDPIAVDNSGPAVLDPGTRPTLRDDNNHRWVHPRPCRKVRRIRDIGPRVFHHRIQGSPDSDRCTRNTISRPTEPWIPAQSGLLSQYKSLSSQTQWRAMQHPPQSHRGRHRKSLCWMGSHHSPLHQSSPHSTPGIIRRAATILDQHGGKAQAGSNSQHGRIWAALL